MHNKTHKSLADRVQIRVDKYKQANALKAREAAELELKTKKVAKLLRNEGWKVLLEALEAHVGMLKNKLVDTNSFRFWKTTELKSVIKAKESIIILMKKQNLKSTLELLVPK